MMKGSIFAEGEIAALLSSHLSAPFVFLETARIDGENRYSYLFYELYDQLLFLYGDEPESLFKKIEDYLKKGFWLAGYFCYEFGYLFEPKLLSYLPFAFNFPLVWLGVFQKPLIIDHYYYTPNFVKISIPDFNVGEIKANIDSELYNQTIKRIKEYIEKGDSYQVNFTFKYKFSFKGDILGFYLNLRRSQPTSYLSFINDGNCYILSFSPELFFRIQDNHIVTRPMKGTISRGKMKQDDEAQKVWLQNDIKNRAENVMIVDLLRNDLGKIATCGSVTVTRLFEVESYRTVHQMTSTITARLKNGVKFQELFSSLFPSGSVTGAPKIRTMQIIAELEAEPRKVYTGAIGYFSPQGKSCFNVAIRTIMINGNHGEMGIGGGIVYDSIDSMELKEANLKAKFMVKKNPFFYLIETIRWERGKGYYLLELHLQRLINSAEYFQISFDPSLLKKYLKDLIKDFTDDIYRVRVLLSLEGQVDISYQPLDSWPVPIKVKLSSTRTDPDDIYLYHKTTNRNLYDREREEALREGFQEVIFLNYKDELTEGSISNIFLEICGKLYTPALTSGLLPGVLRQHLIMQGKVEERLLYLDDLNKADSIYVGNSVRGLLKADLYLPAKLYK